MTPARFLIEPLGRHDRAAFVCGNAALDRYFRQQAGQDQAKRAAAVFVAVDRERENAIAGFYTLSALSVLAAALPPEAIRRLPRYPELPAVLLGRLAVGRAWQGQAAGRLLVNDAVQRAARIDQLGTLFLVVEAKDDAAVAFYTRVGFLPFPEQPRRLFFPLDSFRQRR